MREHEKFLHHFLQIFRRVDRDSNGIINEHEFTELMNIMEEGNTKEEIAYFL